jgi:hypothetical protein
MTEALSAPAPVRIVRVIIPTGDRIPFTLTPSTTVSDLADWVIQDPRNLVPPNRTVLFIYHGRILQASEFVSNLDTMSEFTVHALFRPIAPQAAVEAGTNDLRGFDRLSRMNYTPAEIAQLRDNFHTMQGTTQANREAQIETEEEWFPVIFNNENPVQNLQLPVAVNATVPPDQMEEEVPYTLDQYPWIKLMLGVFLGTFFGVSAVIFMLMPRSDRTFFMGLFLGVGFNLLIKWYLDADLL